MRFGLKESKITSWWVAPARRKLRFINILSKEQAKGELIVAGYMKGERHTRKLYTSSNNVVKITEDGVITAKGTFYPFKEAHPVYLRFLAQANKENTILAFLWEYANQFNKKEVIADYIGSDGVKHENVTFDITPDIRSPVLVSGYSEKLGCNVVFSTFNMRSFCIGIWNPTLVKEEIYRSSLFATPKELDARAQKVREIFRKNNAEEGIWVIS